MPEVRAPEQLDGPGFTAAREGLAALLVDAVDSGASVGFLPPFGLAEAGRYWDGQRGAVERGEELLFLVRGEGGSVDGCVVLALASLPNQTHRAEVKKLLLAGFPFAAAYFGVAGSRLAGGQTFGMRLRRLTVVGSGGRLLDPTRSLVRGTVLVAPWFFNGLFFQTPTPAVRALLWAAGVIVFGVVPASIVLFLAMPSRRQGLHDLLVGSFVVAEKDVGHSVPGGPSSLSRVLVAVWVGLVAVGTGWPSLQPLSPGLPPPMLQALERIPGYQSCQIRPLVIRQLLRPQDRPSARVLHVVVRVSGEGPPEEAIRRAADAVLRFYPQLAQFDQIRITWVNGVDIGAVNWSRSQDETHSLEEWRKIVGL